MPADIQSPEEILPLSPAVPTSFALAASASYSIMQHVAETTDSQIKMGPTA